MRDEKLKEVQPESTKQALRRRMVVCLTGTLLLLLAMVAAPTPSYARVSVGIFVGFGPPALPVYVQPPCPAPGYIWTPGYWAWDPANGYYWVPGTWVPAPFIGAMWTPGYWGYDDDDDGYRWHGGYWGFSVGFYGGINYGYGYNGYGYYGGRWRGDRFYYNREVNHINNVNIVNVYNQRVVENYGPRVSYNGGRGGIDARPTRQQVAAERGRRSGPSNQQLRQERFARTNRAQWARENHGRPEIAATRRPGEFRGNGAVRASRAGEPYRAPVERTRGGQQFSRSAPQRGNNDRGFRSFSQQRNAQPNWQRSENRAPAETRGGREFSRSAPQQGNNDRGFHSFSQQRNAQPNWQRSENRAPAERTNRQPMYRNNQQGSFERPQRQQYRPQEMRRVESRPAPQQGGNFSRQEARGGGSSQGHGGGYSQNRGGGGENGNGQGRH